MNNNIEKRVRQQHQQKKPSHLSSSSPPTRITATPVSPPLSPLDENTSVASHGGNGNKTSTFGEDISKTSASTVGTNEKRRNTWVESAKRKLTPRSATVDGPATADPFAGMKTCINYQQEIERLKTLVPKVEIKKRPLSSSSSSSASSSSASHRLTALTSIGTTSATQETVTTDTTITSPRLGIISTTTPPSSSSSSQVSSSSSSTASSSSSRDSLSSASSSTFACSPPTSKSHPTQHSPHEDPTNSSITVSLNDEPPRNTDKAPVENEDQLRQSSASSSVITDEEKARFLEFMRSWTGGLNGWNEQPMEQQKGWNHHQQPRRSQFSTRSEPTTPLQEIYPDPWYHQQQSQYLHQKIQHPINTALDMTSDLYQPPPLTHQRLSSPPQSALPLSSYQQQPLYFPSIQQRHPAFHHQYHSSPHSHNYNHHLHPNLQSTSSSPMEWHGNLGSSSSTQIGTIGDRHRPTRHHGPFGVSVM